MKIFCVICESEIVNSKEMPHVILGLCSLNVCEDCGHSSFVPKLKKVEDNEFSSEYVKIQQHNESLLKHFFSRKYFIDNSRLLLLNHFIFIDDGMNVLELGPGFPGLFHTLKLTGKQLNLYSVEPNPETNRLFEDYGVKSIGLSFPLRKTFEGVGSSNSNSDNINADKQTTIRNILIF
jgi:hypothetical protein